MNWSRWQEIARLLERARERPPGEQEAFVRAQAGADVELAEEVLRLLRIHHPNVVPALIFGEQDGWHFEKERVTGPTLAEEIRRLREPRGMQEGSGTHLPSSGAETYFRAVAEVVRQVADGLRCAHEHGIVHRDLHPANLMFDAAGRVFIVGFGLAHDEEQGTITDTEVITRTLRCMSPEQARGISHLVDARTDVYALGIVLYELLTLRRPFEGSSPHEILRKILAAEAARIELLNPLVPRDLRVICNTAMARNPAERYPSAEALRDDLARFLAGQAIHARPPSLARVAARLAYRHRHALLGSALALAGLVAWLWSTERGGGG